MNMEACGAVRLSAWGLWLFNLVLHLGVSQSQSSQPRNFSGEPPGVILQYFWDMISNRTQYDYSLPPLSEDIKNGSGSKQGVQVDIGIYVNAIGELNERNMEFLINIYLRHLWTDKRLAYENEMPGVKVISLPDSKIDLIWVPDTYMDNSKEEYRHVVTIPNRAFRINPDGRVFYSQRLSIRLWCAVHLYYFPMDDQQCELELNSYKYTVEEMKLNWLTSGQAEVSLEIPLARFQLKDVQTYDCTSAYSTGTYSCVSAKFFFERQFGYYFLQIYIPSILIVVLSWVSFWLDPRATPGRISLGVLTVLTMSTQMSSAAGASLPKVSYIKSIDVWLTTCMVFLFFALLEFAFCNSLFRMSEKIEKADKKANKQEGRDTLVGNGVAGPSPKKRKKEEPDSLFGIDPQASNASVNITQQPPTAWEIRLDKLKSVPLKHGLTAIRLDKISRVLFPILFLIFNLIYWLTFSRLLRDEPK